MWTRFDLVYFSIVCCRRCLQGWIEFLLDSWIGRRWLFWGWGIYMQLVFVSKLCQTFLILLGSIGSYSHWNHHSSYSYPECFGWERSSYPRVDICCPEEIWISGGNCWALCREGCHPWLVCYCSSWIPSLQAYWWFGCPKVIFDSGLVWEICLHFCKQSLLWCSPLHHGIWS